MWLSGHGTIVREAVIGEYCHPFCIKNMGMLAWHICLFAESWELQSCALCSLVRLFVVYSESFYELAPYNLSK